MNSLYRLAGDVLKVTGISARTDLQLKHTVTTHYITRQLWHSRTYTKVWKNLGRTNVQLKKSPIQIVKCPSTQDQENLHIETLGSVGALNHSA